MRSIIPTSLVVAAALLAPVTASADVLPPSATGPADVGFKRTTLTDHQRTERHVPGGGPRHVPLRVWYPAAAPGPRPAALFTPAEQAAWESSNGLPAASLNGLGGAATSGAAPAPGRHPILLLSPGFGETTAFLSAHGADLASHGYVVVAMDHPGETSAVELPDGRLATLDPRIEQTNPRHAGRLATIRVKDMRFVIDRLRALRGAGRLDLSRIGVFGHSDGGNAAANAMLAERRLDAGIDLDGQISGPVARTGLDRPFGVMLGDGPKSSYGELGAFRQRLRGPHPVVRYPTTGHHGFTDYIWLSAQLGADPEESGFGSVAPRKAVKEQNAWMRRFFDRHVAR